jgi:toxin YoeB
MNIEFSSRGWKDFMYWFRNDKHMIAKIDQLITDIERSPFEGLGKPEPLKHNLRGYWSRRITDEHRMVYKIEQGKMIIFQLRHHYETN